MTRTASVLAVFLAACGGGESDSVVGNWQVEGSSARYEFRPDGTALWAALGMTATGTYRQADPGHLTVDWQPQEGLTLVPTQTFGVEWAEANLVLIEEDGDRLTLLRQ